MRRSRIATVGFQLDLLGRVRSVTSSPGDLDPVLREDVRDRLDDRGMIVRDEHGRDNYPVGR